MIRWFFPESVRAGLPVADRKRVPVLVSMNFILILFFLLAAFTRYRAFPESSGWFFVAIVATTALFVASLALVRAGRYAAASLLSTIGMLLNTSWMAFLLPTENVAELYRFTVYLIASGVANSLVSMDRRQIHFYTAASALLYVAVCVLIYAPFVGGFDGANASIFVNQAMLLAAINLCIHLLDRLNRDLLKTAEDEARMNQARSESLGRLVERAKEGLAAGDALLSASERGDKAGAALRVALDAVVHQATRLSEASESARSANGGVNEYVEGLKLAVDGQGAVLEETGSAVTQIMANIQSMAAVAEGKRAELAKVLGEVEAHERELDAVIQGFERIRGSSKQAAGVAVGIMDVSEKTNMLAMNASIEAAHAGSAGKGFAVIAQEIRKLSEEAQRSTGAIQGALGQNEAAVEQASRTIKAYAASMRSLSTSVRAGFLAMEEILGGLGEAAKGATELMEASAAMNDMARDTGEGLRGAADRLSAGAAKLDEITKRVGELSAKLRSLAESYGSIEAAFVEVRAVGETNIRSVKRLEEGLGAL
jgi:methyl-accepting chemotaxis protein